MYVHTYHGYIFHFDGKRKFINLHAENPVLNYAQYEVMSGALYKVCLVTVNDVFNQDFANSKNKCF